MATVYYARWILLPDGSLKENGALGVENGRISAAGSRSSVRRRSKDRAVNLGPVVLLPGLVNLHTHLEEGVLRGRPRNHGESFAAWLAKKYNLIRQAGEGELENAVALGIRESLAAGTTTIVDASQRGVSPRVLERHPVRSWVVHQLHCESPDDERFQLEALRERLLAHPPSVGCAVGPYALFSLSPDGQRTLTHAARANGWRWVSHIAESAEELQAFAEQSGDLHAWVTRHAPWNYGNNRHGSMHYAITQTLIPREGICVHCNHVTGHELTLLGARQVSIAISSRATDAQGHKPFPFESALKRGINLCAVTESVAENESTSLFDELYSLKMRYPHLDAKLLLRMVTLNPARALGVAHRLGTLEKGKEADVIGLALPHDAGNDLLEQLLVEEPSVRFVMVGGEEIIVDH